jgi:hypothetical protein
MKDVPRLRLVAVLSAIFTYLFFFEYLAPVGLVHVPYDLDGFHFSLDDYAFQALRHGRFPVWDPTIYCGLSFVANVQAALFYPPMWLVFAANIGRRSLSFESLQAMELAHVWLAFLLCYFWLRRRGLAELSSVLGGGIFAFSGYLLEQLQHLGLVIVYAWMPLGLIAIDEAAEQRRWHPLWKLALASALSLLAGYPPMWFVFAACMVSYALCRWKAVVGTVIALGASLLLAMVQLLPALEANILKVHEVRYGSGYRDPRLFLSFLLPNAFDFGLHVDLNSYPGSQYLYLGAPALLGLAGLILVRKWRPLVPILTMLATSTVLMTNPFNLPWTIIRHSGILDQLCRDYYFLAGVALAIAALAAYGLDSLLARQSKPLAEWLPLSAIVALALWSGWQSRSFFPIGTNLPKGWASAIPAGITLALVAFAIYVLPAQKGAVRAALMTATLIAVGIDYKVWGTSKRVNAAEGQVNSSYGNGRYPAMPDEVFRRLQAHPEYRVVVDDVTGPFPTELRHIGLTTPQGFDPFITLRFKRLIERIAHFRSNWLLDIDPNNEPALQFLGVRYFITAETGSLFSRLNGNSLYRPVQPAEQYYRVFEYVNAHPPYGWELPAPGAAAIVRRWEPECREFTVQSPSGGYFTLTEQKLPGWEAAVDGKTARIERWNDAFQAVRLLAGEHTVTFTYRSRLLPLGALISGITVAALGLVAFRERRTNRK